MCIDAKRISHPYWNFKLQEFIEPLLQIIFKVLRDVSELQIWSASAMVGHDPRSGNWLKSHDQCFVGRVVVFGQNQQ